MNFETPQIRELVRLALAEDLVYGDITSDLTISAVKESSAEIIAREPLVFCGGPLITLILDELKAQTKVTLCRDEGTEAPAKAVLAKIKGATRSLLAAERTILNFLQRLSGIASHTRQVVGVSEKITVLDTRKTTPGWRVLEKYAVRMGGAKNHRFGLGDMVLVKDNHIDANGRSVRKTLERVFAGKPLYMPVEVEVRTLRELDEALRFPVQVVMLDNLPREELRKALKAIKENKPEVLVEVSGQVRREQLRDLAALGVQCVSMGGLTTQARAVDIALKLR